jgi:hypothetical protein
MNFKKIYAGFLTLLLVLSLAPRPNTQALAFNLTADPACGSIMLKWDTVPDAVRYYVYRGPGEGQEYAMPLTDFAITDTFYKDTTDLVVNQKYCYFVKAVGKDDKEFLQSAEACAIMTCQDETPTPPDLNTEDCKMVLKYQVDNKFYYKNDIQKGPMDAVPIIRENRVNLMARYLAQETGAVVGWDGTTRTVSIKTPDGTTIEMQIGNPTAKINGVPTPIDPNNKKVAPFIEGGRTYTGLRFISYNLGATGPTDIVWQADTKTAILIFKDPTCKWVCGCIRKLPPSSLTNNISQYGFFENCNSDKPTYTKIPMEMKDRILQLSFLEYIKKYPNQDFWCVELRIDENGNIVGWRARPDQYPNCCKPKPPTDCMWVCGCVRKWTEAPNGNISIFFSKDCKDTTDLLSFVVPLTLKDSVMGLTFLEYFRKYPNHKYWCLQLCIGPNNNIVGWKATPEKYPNCCEQVPVDCKWVPGYIVKAVQTPGTTLWTVSFAVNCKEQQIVDLQMDGSLLDLNLNILLADYIKKYPNNKYWCAEFCVDVNRKIVQWKATPEKYPNCCETTPVDCQWICGCILKAGPSAASNNWFISFSLNCVSSAVTDYQMSPTLLDVNLNMTIADYIKKYPDHKYWCVELCVDANKNVIKWRATPEKYPNCCEQVQVTKICACIVRMTIQPDNNGMYQVYIKKDCLTTDTIPYDLVLNFPATLLDTNLGLNAFDYYNSIPGDPPKMCCIEVAYNSSMIVTTWSAHPDRSPCCEVTDKGRILAYIPTDCIEGTKFIITDMAGNIVWTGQATNEGILDTDCVLKCPDAYRITPKNEKCKFTPEYQDVKVPCCPEKAEVKFDCDCNQNSHKKGRIKGTVFGNCNPGTTVTIYDSTGTVAWTGTTDSTGDYDTGVNCILICGATYKVVLSSATGSTCTYSPQSREVTIKNCCPESAVNLGYERADFKCECPSTGGRIIGYLPDKCIDGTKIVIYNSDGTLVWSGVPNADGTFDTDCKLKCPGVYKVIPRNERCKFTPESMEVKVPCCPEKAEVKFDCDCSAPLGRITGYLPAKCIDGTKIVIYDTAGSVVWSGVPNTDGFFDTGCKIKCNNVYKVVPKNEQCKFTPESMEVKVPCCPEKAEVKFDCDCAIYNGRIVVYMPKECIDGTKVIIYDMQGSVVLTLQPNSDGVFDTGCKLLCPSAYRVVPRNEKCKFSPEYIDVKVPCCPDYAKVEFKCDCSSNFGRIVCYIPSNCIDGTKVVITDSAGNSVWSGVPNANGMIDTDCTLKCNTAYKVIPRNEKCTFSPTSIDVKLPCCPEYAKVEFKCDCSQPGGRIIAYFPQQCIDGTQVVITDATGATVWSGTPNANGMIDTDCKLKCPAGYRITPKNGKCKFLPEFQDVKVLCCPERTEVKFSCDCSTPSKKGRITGYVPRNCIEGTKIIIYDSTTGAAIWSGAPNANGYFETSAQGTNCILPCPGTYKVVPTKQGCTFTPESQVVTLSERMCCDYTATVEFKCDCAGKNDSTVYITETGKKYHRESCKYLNDSKKPISLEDAKKQGYTPCTVCNPPTMQGAGKNDTLPEPKKVTYLEKETYLSNDMEVLKIKIK